MKEMQNITNSKALYESPCCGVKWIDAHTSLCLSGITTNDYYVEVEADWD